MGFLARAGPLAPTILEQALDAAVQVGFLPRQTVGFDTRASRWMAFVPNPRPGQQHNACPRNDFLRRLAIGDEPLQCRPVTGPDIQACIDVSHAAIKSDLQVLGNPINGSEH